MLTSGGSFLLKTMLSKTPVDMFRDYRFVAQVGKLSTALMVPANSPYKSADELIAALKANPGKLRWAHSGRGGFHYVAGRAFLESNNLKAQDVPFKGGGPARAALVGSQTDFGFIGIQQARGFENLVSPLALVSNELDAVIKDVPTFKELGIKFVNVNSPVVVMAPKRTPEAVVTKLATYMEQIAELPQFAAMVEKRGTAPQFAEPGTVKNALLDMREASRGVVSVLTGAAQ